MAWETLITWVTTDDNVGALYEGQSDYSASELTTILSGNAILRLSFDNEDFTYTVTATMDDATYDEEAGIANFDISDTNDNVIAMLDPGQYGDDPSVMFDYPTDTDCDEYLRQEGITVSLEATEPTPPARAVNKVVYGSTTLIDLTADTATAADVLAGETFHAANGTAVTGTCTYDADTSDATATAAQIFAGFTAYAGGAKLTGTASAGDANFIRGTFTTTSTENSVQEVAIPYSGTGYPVAVLLMPTGGPYNSSSAQYNTIRQYAIMFAAMVKSNWSSTPNYANTGVRNYGTSLYFYKSSSSSATSYAQSSGYNQVLYTGSTAPTGTNRLALKWKNATTLWLYVSAAGTYGFWPDVEYTYYVIYSE